MDAFQGLTIPRTAAELCDPAQAALIVYDMQVGILRQISGGDRVTAQVGRLLEAARSRGMRTFFTRHMSLPVNLMGVFQMRQAMAWQRKARPEDVAPWFLRDSP